jgi:hypothetical protein
VQAEPAVGLSSGHPSVRFAVHDQWLKSSSGGGGAPPQYPRHSHVPSSYAHARPTVQWPGGAPYVFGHAGSFASRAASFTDASLVPPLLLLVLLVEPLDDPPPLDEEDEEEDDDEVDGPLSTVATPPPQAAPNRRAAAIARLFTT